MSLLEAFNALRRHVPVEGGDPVSTEVGDPAPTEVGDPEPAEGEPNEGGDPEPTEGGDPEPTEGGDPEPTDGGDQEPSEGGDAELTDGGDQEPSEGGDAPVPAAAAQPGIQMHANLGNVFGALRQRVKKRRGEGAWAGALRRCPAKTKFMVQCRKEKAAKRKVGKLHTNFGKLADAWDIRVLREGDRAQRHDGKEDVLGDDAHETTSTTLHPNQYTPDGVLREVFTHIGRSTETKGIEGTAHSLGMSTVVAAVAKEAQQDAFAIIDDKPFVLIRGYDLTPLRVQFGVLQQLLAPSARYLIPEDNQVSRKPIRWKSVSLSEYQQWKGIGKNRLPHKGVVELMAQRATVGQPDGESWRHDVFLVPPRFCEKGNSTCIFNGVDDAVPKMSAGSIQERATQVRFGIVAEIADAAGPNTRKQLETFRLLPNNILGFRGVCASHRIHLVVVSTTKEKEVIGDVHAVVFSAGLTSHHEMLLRAYREWLSKPGNFSRYTGMPGDPLVRRHSETLWKHCRQRHLHVTRGRLHEGVDDCVVSKRIEEDSDLRDRFLAMWNGDPRLPHAYHNCVLLDDGRWCCKDIDDAREKFFSAGVEAGVLLSPAERPPISNRWGSCTTEMSHVTDSCHRHNALGQAAMTAFPHWRSARADHVNSEDPDDIEAQRQYIRSKTWRFVKVTSSAPKRRNMMLVTWVCAPLDHAVQRVQHLSSQRGSVLTMLDDEYSPIVECQLAFAEMIGSNLESESGSLSTAFWFYGFGSQVINEVRAMIGQMSALMWYKFLDFETWPLWYLGTADVRNGSNRAENFSKKLFEAHFCCVDVDFGLKAKGMFPDPVAMANDKDFQDMIRYFVDALVLDGMVVERLLALIKKSSPTKSKDDLPLAEKLVSQGFLTQWRQIHHSVVSDDAAFVTRKGLLKVGAPLKAQPRIRKSTSKGSGFFLHFAAVNSKQRLRQKDKIGEFGNAVVLELGMPCQTPEKSTGQIGPRLNAGVVMMICLTPQRSR